MFIDSMIYQRQSNAANYNYLNGESVCVSHCAFLRSAQYYQNKLQC